MNLTGSIIKSGYPLLRLYWFLFRPATSGVRNLVLYKGKYLLIKNTYLDKWNFPGGGIKKYETPLKAVIRETYEETGLIVKNIRHIGTYISHDDYKTDTVYCYSSRSISPEVSIQLSEISAFGWFSHSDLPDNLHPGVGILLKLYNKQHVSP